jgi:protein-tyrosine phosphatase
MSEKSVDLRDGMHAPRTVAQGHPEPSVHPDGRTVSLEGAFNVRDLGGIATSGGASTRRGIVYRGDALDWLTARDEDKLFGELSIGTIIDLRTRGEAGGDGLADARHFPAVKALSIPLIPDERADLEPFPFGDPEAVGRHYIRYLGIPGSPAVEVILAVTSSLDRGVPVLFHCAAGRDRTGVVAALLLLLARGRAEEIVQDYMDSNLHAAEVSRHLMHNPLYQRTDVDNDPGFVDRRAIRRFMKLLRAEFGGAAAWAEAAGINRMTLDTLRHRMVLPSR